MASIILNISDLTFQRILDGFAGQHNYTETIPDTSPENIVFGATVPNPESKEQFLKRKVLDFIAESVKAYELMNVVQTSGILNDNTIEDSLS